MKIKPVLALLLAAVLGSGGIGILAWKSLSAPSKSTPGRSGDVLAVDDLRNKPERFTGEIHVFGVVGGTRDSEQLFGLIDKREFEACGTTTCPEFLLPVRWRGAMPDVGDEVTVTGELQQSTPGLILEAARIDAP